MGCAKFPLCNIDTMHENIACSKKKNVASPTAPRHSFLIIALLLLRLLRGRERAKPAYLRASCTWGGKSGSSLQVTNMRKIYNYSSMGSED